MFCQDVTPGRSSLNIKICESEVDLKISQFQIRFQVDPHDDVGVLDSVVLTKPEDTSPGAPAGKVVQLLAGDPGDLKTLHHGTTSATVTVDHVVNFSLIAIEDRYVEIVFSNEDFLGHFDDTHCAVA